MTSLYKTEGLRRAEKEFQTEMEKELEDRPPADPAIGFGRCSLQDFEAAEAEERNRSSRPKEPLAYGLFKIQEEQNSESFVTFFKIEEEYATIKKDCHYVQVWDRCTFSKHTRYILVFPDEGSAHGDLFAEEDNSIRVAHTSELPRRIQAVLDALGW